MKERLWSIRDHLCRDCGGRILRCEQGNGMTPGGNPVYACADCGKKKSGIHEDVLCWCGFSHRGQYATAYRCLPYSILTEHPEFRDAFLACGCDPARGEVGIMLERDYLYRHPPGSVIL